MTRPNGSTNVPIVFAPVVRESAVTVCANHIRSAILRGDVAPGRRLPPERELAASLGVNRGTVRSALRELELAGLLSVLQGSGYVVKDFRETGGPSLVPALAELARDAGDFPSFAADLLHVRRALAGVMLDRLAAQKLSRATTRTIEDAVAAFTELAGTVPRPPGAALAEADLRVIRALVAATESAVLGLFINPIAAVLERLPDLRDAIYAEPTENAAAYRLVLEALKQGALPAGLATAALEERDQATITRLRGARPTPTTTPRRTR